jgi:cytochrome c-type biogenesis protein CcmE
MNAYLKFGLLTALIVGALVWLAVGGVTETQTYYKTIPELEKLGSAGHRERLRVAGNVEPGSIVKAASGVTFVLHQGPQQLKVVYRGTDPLPDTCKGGAQAIADGRLGSDGVFEASKVQAKCASKYEAKPPQQNLSHPSSAPAKVTDRMALPKAAGSAG